MDEKGIWLRQRIWGEPFRDTGGYSIPMSPGKREGSYIENLDPRDSTVRHGTTDLGLSARRACGRV